MTSAYAVVGPARHGVVEHALGLARSSPALAARLVRVERLESAPSALSVAPLTLEAELTARGVDRAMVHVTDRLFGSSPEAAAELVTGLARRIPLAVSLHDIPQPAEGPERHARRRAAYGLMAAAARTVIVASDHERVLLAGCVEDRVDLLARIVVLPLPAQSLPRSLDARDRHGCAAGGRIDIGVLGFLYPGKGVDAVIDAAGMLRASGHDVGVTNYGGVAPGHAEVVTALDARARAAGVPFTVTGYLPDDELASALRRTGVPVAAHRHISASGSVNTWLAAGRRPVVTRGAYVSELSRRLPGAVTLTDDLPSAIGAALANPDSTWLGRDVVLEPTWTQSAAAHLGVLESL